MRALLLIIATIVSGGLANCGGNNTLMPPSTSASRDILQYAPTNETVAGPAWRFIIGGWVSPRQEAAGAFSHELRAFVIADQEQMDAYFGSFTTQRTRGNTASLGRVDFSRSILLAAYYLWRPLQGEPLSFVGVSLEGNQARVQLELNESPQGKEYPYLPAPMEVVAVDRSAFPTGQPIEFVFHLNGKPTAQVVATLK